MMKKVNHELIIIKLREINWGKQILGIMMMMIKLLILCVQIR